MRDKVISNDSLEPIAYKPAQPCKQKMLGIVLSITFFIIGVPCIETWAAINYYPYIINTLPADGYVEKLIIPKNSHNLLYALVKNDGRPKTTDKTGLYIFDISNVKNIKQITYFPITSPIGMDISLDEKTLFLYSAYFEGHDPKSWCGIITFDVTNPKTLREIGKVDLDILKARLSSDGKYLFITERGLIRKNEKGYIFSIFSVSNDSNPKLLTQVKSQDSWSPSAYGFYPIPGGKYLLVEGSNNHLITFDISNPSNPKMQLDRDNHLGHPQSIGSNGVLYLNDDDELVLAKLFPKTEKLGTLQGRFSDTNVTYISEDNKIVYISSLDKTLYILDVSDPKSPKALSQYIVPNYIGSATPAQNGSFILVGLLGAIAVIDPNKAITTSEQLRVAHVEALRQYNRKDDEFDFERTKNAINVLKAAGIDYALEKKPSGIADKILAGILNDYGFFLTKAYRYKEAIKIYKGVIELDPGRSIAYLNLGDSLRSQLSQVNSFKEKIDLTKEIKSAYLQYKQRGGSNTKMVDSFLSLNVVDKSQSNFCEYVEAYTNQGRLKELFGSGNSVMRANKNGSMQVKISYEGTAHMPSIRLIDNSTNEDILQAVEKGEVAEENHDTTWVQNIAVIPFSDGHHLLDYNNGGYLVSSSPIGAAQKKGSACRFSVHVTESFIKKTANTQICKRVQFSEPLPYISFDEPHSITYQMIQNAGFFETSEGKAGNVDFDNDGENEVLVELQYASGAGPGCDYNFFDLLNEKRNGFSNSKKRQLLHELQGVGNKPHMRHPVPSCSGNTTGWFRYNGITYYETKYPGNQPENESQEFHTVSYIKNGKINKVCEASFRLQVKVKQ